jgi:isopenicillin N synthase-like dioxygenase
VQVKRLYKADENNRGWNPLGEETLDPEHQTRGDTKEGYYIGREVPAGSAEAKLPLHGPNVWPNELGHPTLHGWRDAMEAYYYELTNLARRLLPLFALALGLPRDTFLRPGYFDRPVALLRLLR